MGRKASRVGLSEDVRRAIRFSAEKLRYAGGSRADTGVPAKQSPAVKRGSEIPEGGRPQSGSQTLLHQSRPAKAENERFGLHLES